MYVSDLSVKEDELLFELNSTEEPYLDRRTLAQINDLKDMKGLLRYPFNVKLELAFIATSIVNRPDLHVYRVENIYTRQALNEINEYVCKYNHTFLVKPMLSSPFIFEGYLFCYDRRKPKIADKRIANNTLKLQRFVLALTALAEIWFESIGTDMERTLMRNPCILNDGLSDMFSKRQGSS